MEALFKSMDKGGNGFVTKEVIYLVPNQYLLMIIFEPCIHVLKPRRCSRTGPLIDSDIISGICLCSEEPHQGGGKTWQSKDFCSSKSEIIDLQVSKPKLMDLQKSKPEMFDLQKSEHAI